MDRCPDRLLKKPVHGFSNEAARRAWFSLSCGINDTESHRQVIDVGRTARGSVWQAVEIAFRQPAKRLLSPLGGLRSAQGAERQALDLRLSSNRRTGASLVTSISPSTTAPSAMASTRAETLPRMRADF